MTTPIIEFAPGELVQSPVGNPGQYVGPTEGDPETVQLRILSGVKAGHVQTLPKAAPFAPISAEAKAKVAAAWKHLLPPEVAPANGGGAPAAVEEGHPPAPEVVAESTPPADLPKKRTRARKRAGADVVAAPAAETPATVAAPAAVAPPPPPASQDDESLFRYNNVDVAATQFAVEQGAPTGAPAVEQGAPVVAPPAPTASAPDAVDVSSPVPRVHAAKLDWLETIELPQGIKGLRPTTVKLGQRTLLVGDNDTGKTAIINASTLLAGGYVNDLGVRDGVRLPERLFAALVPRGKDSWQIVGRTAEGARGKFSLRLGEGEEGGGGKITKFRRSPVEKAALVFDTIAEILRKEPRAVRDFLVGAIYTALTPADLSARLPEDLRSPFAELVSRQMGTGPYEPAALLRLDKAALGEAKQATAQAETLRKVAEEQRAQLAAHATLGVDEQWLAALRVEVETWRTHREAAAERARQTRAAEVRRGAARPRQDELTAIQIELVALVQDCQQAHSQVETLRLQIAQAASPLVEAATLLQGFLAGTPDVTQCLACGAAHDSVRLQTWRSTWTSYAQQHDAFVTRVRADLQAAEAHLSAIVTQIQTRGARAETLRELLADVPAAPEHPASAYDDVVRQTEEGIRTREARLSQATTGRGVAPAETAVQDLERRVQAETARASSLTRLADRLAAARDEMAKVASTAFCERVQRWLPPDKRFGIDLATGEVGFVEPVAAPGSGAGEPALCIAPGGGGTVRLLGALAAACIPVDAEWALLVLPDRFQTPKHLRETMEALADWPGQVIAQATHMPFRGAVRGWTILDTNALAGATGEGEE